MKKQRRTGIFSGTFDPVHAGHIAFALQAIAAAQLDEVCFVPERRPRQKPQVTHYAHRVAMIRRAIRPHAQLAVIELEDRMFTVAKTLPRLTRRFRDSQLVFICGADTLEYMHDWPNVVQLLGRVELCVGLRAGDSEDALKQTIANLPVPPRAVEIIESHAATVSSTKIRNAIRSKRRTHGLLTSVVTYARQEWLYI